MTQNKPRLCFVTAVPISARAFLMGPMKALGERWEVYYAGNFESEEDVADLPVKDRFQVPIARKPSIKQDLKALIALYRLFKTQKFNSVHAITPKAILLSSIAAFMARTPNRIMTFTGQVWATMEGAKRNFYKAIDKLNVLLNNQILVDGISQREFLELNGIIKKNKAIVLGDGSISGIDTKRFNPNKQTRDEIRKSLGFTDSNVVLVFVGRLCRDKGIVELLKSFNNLADKDWNLKLLLVGPDEENCHSKVNDYRNLVENTNVFFYGSTRTPEILLQAGDIFVLPTYREGFGVSVLEASCLGLPVVCTDTYGVLDAMVDGVTGLRCKTKNVETLTDCISKLANDAELRKQLGDAGRERVLTLFSKERLNKEWVRFYSGLLSQK